MKPMASNLFRSLGPAVGLLLAWAPAIGQVTVKSSPVGVIEATVPRGESGLAVPLLGAEVFVGVVASNTADTLQFPAEAGDIGALLGSGEAFYVEVVTGPGEGERLDVDTAATIAAGDSSVALALGGDSHSTLSMLAADALAGARCVIRPHLTLARLQAMFEPGLVGRDHFNFADGVRLFEQGKFESYYLDGDGASWRHRGSSGSVDFRDKVIPPDVGLLVEVKSGDQQWVNAGVVRTNVFRKNLVEGLQSFATGFPQDMSPVEIGAFLDTNAPAATRWTGNNNFVFADQIQVTFNRPRPLEIYYLRADGSTWRRMLDPTNVANDPILGATDMILVRRHNPDSEYVVLPPFDL